MAVIRRRDRSEDGFTLLEVLFALTILGVGILAIGLAQLSSLKMSAKSRSLSQAMYIAQEQLDLFMAMPVTDPTFTTAVNDLPDPLGPITAFGNYAGGANEGNGDARDGITFTRSWTVQPNTPGLGLTQITVFVSWDSAQGATHRIELQGIKRLS